MTHLGRCRYLHPRCTRAGGSVADLKGRLRSGVSLPPVDDTEFGITAIVFGVAVLLTAERMLEANAKSVRESRIFRGRGVDGRWAIYNRFVIYSTGALAVGAGVASLLGLLPDGPAG